ncbi:MAG: stage II sporulation protein M [Gammaproteobacteria bacterium]|nr:stage II sporulation protein M [Gammaproteobacteria bacterium]
MKQQSFEQQHQQRWEDLESQLDKSNKNRDSAQCAETYMAICQHLALAKQRLYDATLIERLNKLVMQLYRELYRYRSESRLNFYAFFVQDFPLALYRHRYFIALAILVSIVPGLVAGLWIYFDDTAIYSVLDSSSVRQIEDMYDPAARILGRERESETDIFMFGFYIQNNISVAFRCFAAGLLAGIGTLFVLFFNGLHIGSIAGHLTRLDYVDTFYPFVVTHGAFELTAIVFSGAAGFRLGYAVLQPGNYSRLDSIKLAGRESIPMIYGIILMLIIAAFIEAFWSSSTSLPISVKYTVGSICWLMVLLYSFSGRRYGPR